MRVGVDTRIDRLPVRHVVSLVHGAYSIAYLRHATAPARPCRFGDPGLRFLLRARVTLPAVRYRSVVFDCDSTLSAIEGIDELAGPHRAAVAELTGAAMRGDVPLEAVYGRRLALIQPTRASVEALADKYIRRLVPDAMDVVAALRAAGIAVRVMSGGLLPPVRAMARALGLAPADVAAVDIHFDERGTYAGFDDSSPLVRAGGKLDLLAQWRHDLPAPMILVGDGATDLEAKPAADLFVAFAGFVDRPGVTAAADVVVRACSLAPIYTIALGEPPTEPRARALFKHGATLLDSHPHVTSEHPGAAG